MSIAHQLLNLYRERICQSVQSGGVLFHIVHFGYLRGAMSEDVCDLLWGEGYDRAVGLFNAVHKVGCEGMA